VAASEARTPNTARKSGLFASVLSVMHPPHADPRIEELIDIVHDIIAFIKENAQQHRQQRDSSSKES
jgi:hypothetical protein